MLIVLYHIFSSWTSLYSSGKFKILMLVIFLLPNWGGILHWSLDSTFGRASNSTHISLRFIAFCSTSSCWQINVSALNATLFGYIITHVPKYHNSVYLSLEAGMHPRIAPIIRAKVKNLQSFSFASKFAYKNHFEYNNYHDSHRSSKSVHKR